MSSFVLVSDMGVLLRGIGPTAPHGPAMVLSQGGCRRVPRSINRIAIRSLCLCLKNIFLKSSCSFSMTYAAQKTAQRKDPFIGPVSSARRTVKRFTRCGWPAQTRERSGHAAKSALAQYETAVRDSIAGKRLHRGEAGPGIRSAAIATRVG
jgi:hypothetical protein